MNRRSCCQSRASRSELDRRQGVKPSAGIGRHPHCRSLQCAGFSTCRIALRTRESARSISFRAAGASCDLLDDDLIARRCAARNGISLQPKPTQCRNVARSGSSDSGRQPSPSGAGVPQSPANAVGECALPLRRNGSSCRDAIIHAKRRACPIAGTTSTCRCLLTSLTSSLLLISLC